MCVYIFLDIDKYIYIWFEFHLMSLNKQNRSMEMENYF